MRNEQVRQKRFSCQDQICCELLLFLIINYKRKFTPIEVSREIGVTNRTVINRLSVLAKQGFIVPIMVNQRIRSYELSEFTRNQEQEIKRMIN